MDPRRLRLWTILAIAALAALLLLASTQPWWSIRLTDASLEVSGTVASPALAALAACSFALAAALSLAGPVFRAILGVLQVLVGFTVIVAAATSMADPVAVSSALITEATGVAGRESLDSIVEGVTLTPWPTLAIGFGVLTLLAGVFLLATFRRWPEASRKYRALRLETPDGDTGLDWDAPR